MVRGLNCFGWWDGMGRWEATPQSPAHAGGVVDSMKVA